MKKRLLLLTALLSVSCGEGKCPLYFASMDYQEFIHHPELQQTEERDTFLSVGWMNERWYFPLPYPDRCEVYFGTGISFPVGAVTSGILEIGYIVGGLPFLACQNRDPQEAIIVTAENYDDFDFLVQARLAYLPTGDVPPLSYDESPFWARDWLSYDIDPVKVDLGGMLSGESHRFGQVRVDGEDDYFFIGVFDAPEWRVSVPLDRLPSRCFVQVSCTLECYRKSNGLRLYFSGNFGSGGSWHGSGLGYYEDGALTMGVFRNPDCPSEGFLPLPYYESGQKYVVYPQFFSDKDSIDYMEPIEERA